MNNKPQRTSLAILRDHVNAWRKKNHWSRETVVHEIVDMHAKMGADTLTGIRFDPNTQDVFERTKVNAERVFRWLDDDSKDNNLMPLNFMPSVLSAMPPDIRVACMNDLFRFIGVVIRPLAVYSGDTLDATKSLIRIIKENADANVALAALTDGVTYTELVTAQKELSESIETLQSALAQVETGIASWTGECNG